MIGRALLVAGLGFGDEGKGSVVDWLARRHGAELVVRYNGGPQAAHHVVTEDGRTHCFAQLGAGTLVPSVRTFLSRFMLVDPLALVAEVAALRACGVHDAWERLQIDPRCVVVTPFHRLLNQMQEVARGGARHGSCGRGVGQAQLDSESPGGRLPVLRAGDLRDPARLRAVLRLQWQVKVDQGEQLLDRETTSAGAAAELAGLLEDLRAPHRPAALAEAYEDLVRGGQLVLAERPTPAEVALFEGAQGVLLDRDHGFFPHVTPSRTTFAQAQDLLDEWAPQSARVRLGVLRGYATRHGAGPLPTEEAALSQALPDRHNSGDPWQGPFRVGWFDGVLARHALRVCARAGGGVDALVVTCLDRLNGAGPLRLASAYRTADGGEHADVPAALHGAGVAAGQLRTDWLKGVRPIYAELPPGDAEAYVAALEEQLGVGVAAVSLGPTAADKRLIAAAPRRGF